MLKPPVIANIALFSYIPVFLILLKVRSIKLSKNWFVPIVAIYFGLVIATLFALFLNGTDSTWSAKDSFFSVLVDVLNPKNKRGKVLFGGYFGLILGLFLADFFTKQKKFSDFLDISAISTSLLFSIWRLGCFAGGFEFAVDGDIGVLVETGVAFHARFGCSAASDYTEIMGKEPQAPLKGCGRVVMFECMCLTLCEFDEFTVRHTGG